MSREVREQVRRLRCCVATLTTPELVSWTQAALGPLACSGTSAQFLAQTSAPTRHDIAAGAVKGGAVLVELLGGQAED